MVKNIADDLMLTYQRVPYVSLFQYSLSGTVEKVYPKTGLPQKKESSYNVSKIGKKGRLDSKETLHSGANHQ